MTSLQPCQFFNSPKGCRNGDSCRFLHSTTATIPEGRPLEGTGSTKPAQPRQPVTTTTSPSSKQRQVSKPATTRAPVRKPVPKALQNVDKEEATATLRAFEISQLESRFGSTFVKLPANRALDEDCFELKIVPSDPDFPYEIEALHVRLYIPKSYPDTPCSLDVLNKDIPIGFSTNLERGFKEAVVKQKRSLLAHLNWLDVNMEQLLQKPPAPTIRFVGHGNNSTGNSPTLRTLTPPTPKPAPKPAQSSPKPVETPPPPPPPARAPEPAPVRKVFTAEQIEQAKGQRQQQWNQIQARFRATVQTISSTEVQISLEVVQKGMPVKWEGPLWMNILVPATYPLEPCEIRLKEDGHNPEIELWRARNVEEGFRKTVAAMPQLSLFQLLNQLNRDLKDLMNLPEPVAKPARTPAPIVGGVSHSMSTLSVSSKAEPSGSSTVPQPMEKDRQVVYIDRPQKQRNFAQDQDQGALTSEDDDDDENDEDEEIDSEEESDETAQDSSSGEEELDEEDVTSTSGPSNDTAPKRGIEIRMPDLKLEHISLLYCRSLNLLVRCNRCKSLIDLPELAPDDGQNTKVDKRKWKTCDTCQSLLGGHFRTEYIHIQSKTIGFLDLAGCVAYDLLPSTFVPTCSECDQVHTSNPEGETSSTLSTSSPATASPTGFRQKVGRGMSATANCRKCHVRMTFTMEGEIKFVKLSPGDLMRASSSTLEQLPLKKKLLKNKSMQGIEAELKVGEPLPRKGACDHYKKSRRWFRFPCCSKVYPCHLCHDEKETTHESEYAKRMICGHCSREQAVSDKPCLCGESPVKTGGSGAFWEGGEGMRDKSRMSNKDSKKYKGANKTVAKKQVGAENVRKRAPKF
ncbi:hypothetical protein BGZ52_012335 [Haplosporangium bisporale]|nr:hypothetical protein BGZ52_012335 [Haplosporangium bisporale]